MGGGQEVMARGNNGEEILGGGQDILGRNPMIAKIVESLTR